MPLKSWIKNALDQVIQVCMGERDLEFVWVGDDAIAAAGPDTEHSRERGDQDARRGEGGAGAGR